MGFKFPLTSKAVVIPNITKVNVSIPTDYTYMNSSHYYLQIFLVSPCFVLSIINLVSFFIFRKLSWASRLNWLLFFPVATDPIRILFDLILFSDSDSNAILFVSRCFRIITAVLISGYLVSRALLVLTFSFVRKWGGWLRVAYLVVIGSYGTVYFVLNAISFSNSAIVPTSWYNPVRVVFFSVICGANIACDLFFMLNLSKSITFKDDFKKPQMIVYLVPCGLLAYYIIEKILLAAGYASNPGSSSAIDEYNNSAFLAFTLEIYLILHVQGAIKESISRISSKRASFSTSGVVPSVIINDSGNEERKRVHKNSQIENHILQTRTL
ncbi:hypothetical protein HK096_006846 [Nowakowskiella sp. JEL0078]|nr:hypothetical protein HK096_006846 [Nowakowskiella sp. JEL0078]